jgi:uncharacterized pyridoxal phosphate-containing UPF0001 family protein
MTRRDEIAAGLDAVRRRIADAASAAGRSADGVTLVAVTKFFPASDVRILAELGVTDVGENRHPEAGDKCAECQDLALRWHFIGGLQSNKASAVGAYADVVESACCSRSASTLPTAPGVPVSTPPTCPRWPRPSRPRGCCACAD